MSPQPAIRPHRGDLGVQGMTETKHYGATESHLWFMSKIPSRTWDDCHTTSERKSRTHTYDLVDLLIELALEREDDSHMEKFLKKHLGPGGTPTPEGGKGKGPKSPTNANQGGGKALGARFDITCKNQC